eukprot:CAMPEP_0168338734 /NCGR_PEP_ID=MMETSP0213-20121227/13029_1 /TAXON_ID=151035 /ORGANISM="Euplotes harpa, Strain FSP1.4" /LENGTH=177 /DNA_ID=CAMNT_0008344605 /DNA_START=425 /DNA_END=954 /DNA_ORIENTATION=-
MPIRLPKAKPVNQPDPNSYRYTISDQESHRILKMRRIEEAELESKHESNISLDKVSEHSSAMRSQTHRHIKPPVSMNNILKNLSLLKNEVKMNIYDETNKNIVHLNQLDSTKIGITQSLVYIEEYNSRAPKIIENCLFNIYKNRSKRQYTNIDQEIYTFQMPLRPPSAEPISHFNVP